MVQDLALNKDPSAAGTAAGVGKWTFLPQRVQARDCLGLDFRHSVRLGLFRTYEATKASLT